MFLICEPDHYALSLYNSLIRVAFLSCFVVYLKCVSFIICNMTYKIEL